MRVGTKIGLGFSILTGLLVINSLVGILQLKSSVHGFTIDQAQRIEYIKTAEKLTLHLLLAQRCEQDCISLMDTTLADSTINHIEKSHHLADRLVTTSSDSTIISLISELKHSLDSYAATFDSLLQVLNHQKDSDNINLVNTRRSRLRHNADQALDLAIRIVKTCEDATLDNNEKLAGSANKAVLVLAVLGILAVIGSIIISIAIIKNIRHPLQIIVEGAMNIASGDLSTPVELHRNDEIGQLGEAFRTMQQTLQHRVDIADRIAHGQIDVDIKINSDKDRLGMVMTTLRDRLKVIVDAVRIMGTEQAEGDSDAMVDTDQFEGVFREMAVETNNAVRIHVENIRTILSLLSEYSRGDLRKELPSLPGKQAGANHAMHELRNNLIQIVAAVKSLAARAIDGQLSSRADTEQFQGVFREMVDGINRTLDEISKPILEAAYVLGAMAEGDLSQRVSGDYKGDHALIKDAVNQTASSIQRLSTDTNMLVQTALAGDLSNRADEHTHEGDFRMIVEGINQSLDAFLQPISAVIQVLSIVAQGDLTPSVQGEYKGDLAILQSSLNQTLQSLNELLARVAYIAEQVNAGSGHLTDMSQNLSEGAVQQAASLEQIASTMQQIGLQARQSMENAMKTDQFADAARSSAVKGNHQMERVEQAMTEIRSSSSDISKVIKVIDEIASQINLLALNAAVEAARAGEAGEGFAVVADEVYDLAQRSADAVRETTELIENSIERVEEGTIIVTDTAKSFEEIVRRATDVSTLITQIAIASKEQSRGIEQISSALLNVERITQSNAANSQETASAAEQLENMASRLHEMLEKFQLTISSEQVSQEIDIPELEAIAGFDKPVSGDQEQTKDDQAF